MIIFNLGIVNGKFKLCKARILTSLCGSTEDFLILSLGKEIITPKRCHVTLKGFHFLSPDTQCIYRCWTLLKHQPDGLEETIIINNKLLFGKTHTCRFKRCECDNSSLIDVLSLPKLLVMFIGEYLPVSPCLLVTLSLYNSSVFSASSVSSCCRKDFSELRSLSLKTNKMSFLCLRGLTKLLDAVERVHNSDLEDREKLLLYTERWQFWGGKGVI